MSTRTNSEPISARPNLEVTKLDTYIARTVTSTVIIASAGLVFLFVIFTFLDQMDDFREGYDLVDIMRYVGYSAPRIFYETLPFAALIGCLAGLGLLANTSELIVMRSSGVSTWHIFWSATKPALILILVGIFIGEMLLPDFERAARTFKQNAKQDEITPQGGFWFRERDVYMHFNSVSSDGELKEIHQYYLNDEKELIKTLWASYAKYNEENSYWLMENIRITHLNSPTKRLEERQQMIWRTELTPKILSAEILVDPDKMSMRELWEKIRYMNTQGLNTKKYELGLWSKIMQPVATLSLVFVAVAFVFGPLRETTMGMRVVTGLIIGILFKFVQDLLSPASLVFGFSPFIATLAPILACTFLGYLLIKRAN